MNLSDSQIRDMLAIKERTLQEIERHQGELEMLEKQLAILEAMVKQSSFARASSLRPAAAPAGGRATSIEEDIVTEGDSTKGASGPDSGGGKQAETVPITRNGEVIAEAHVWPDRVSIIIDESLEIEEETPPFRSFFVGRIIGEMKRKDVSDDTLPPDMAIECAVTRRGSAIGEITVRNYRTKGRLDEIISTANWSLNRMLEKTGG